MFKKATREQLKARIALDGPSGSGKTYTALRCASAFGDRVAVIDTEHGAASKYSGEQPDGVPWEFDVVNLTDFSPLRYVEAIEAAGHARYDVLVIDSLSHSWMGKGGALEMVDNSGDKNSYTAWGKVTPVFRRMIEAILASPCHVIATMRTKTEYVLEKDEKGRNVPRKIGTTPVIRDGIEYEFDLVCDIDIDHTLRVMKTRCNQVDGAVSHKPAPAFWSPIVEWLRVGTPRAMIEPQQAATILQLKNTLGIDDDKFKAGLVANFSVESAERLTTQQAGQLIDRLTARMNTNGGQA
jgi:hypothetical protein